MDAEPWGTPDAEDVGHGMHWTPHCLIVRTGRAAIYHYLPQERRWSGVEWGVESVRVRSRKTDRKV